MASLAPEDLFLDNPLGIAKSTFYSLANSESVKKLMLNYEVVTAMLYSSVELKGKLGTILVVVL